MLRALVLALGGVVCSTALTACSGGDTAGADPGPISSAATSTSPPTTSAPTATTDPPAPVAPTLPDIAKEKSTAGAKAFVKYSIDLLNYSHARASTRAFRASSSPQCGACEVLSDAIEEMRQRGGGQKGGGWSTLSIASLPANGPSQRNFVVHLGIDSGTSRKSRTAPVRRIEAGKAYVDFHLQWENREWRLLDLVPG